MDWTSWQQIEHPYSNRPRHEAPSIARPRRSAAALDAPPPSTPPPAALASATTALASAATARPSTGLFSVAPPQEQLQVQSAACAAILAESVPCQTALSAAKAEVPLVQLGTRRLWGCEQRLFTPLAVNRCSSARVA